MDILDDLLDIATGRTGPQIKIAPETLALGTVMLFGIVYTAFVLARKS